MDAPHITAKQVKMARLLLDWQQSDLAREAGLSVTTISGVERELPNSYTLKSLHKIQRAFEAHDIEFLEGEGMRRSHRLITVLDGPNCIMEAHEDIYQTLLEEGGEVLYTGVDERKSGPEMTKLIHKFKESRIPEKNLICEGDTYLLGPVTNYRWVPKRFYTPMVTAVYHNKVAFTINQDSPKVIIIRDPDLAESHRKAFYVLWEAGKVPEIT